jgi:regulator of sigma E protease
MPGWLPYVLAAAGFASLIILHEFGHFIAAKKTGMRVERFVLFFPPLLFKTRRGETEYGIGAVPLGGYVKITGMNPEEELPPDVAPRAYYHQPVWKRIVVIGAGPVMNLALAFVLLFGLAFGASELTSRVGDITPDSPAEGNLEQGDEIVAVDGRTGDQLDFVRRVSRHKCPGPQRDGCQARTPVALRVIRDGRPLTLRVTPEYDAELKRTRIGFAYATEPLNPGPLEAARISADLMWTVTKGTVEVLARIFQKEQREQISGVVGNYEITRQGFSESLRRALTIVAVISLSLGLINLFPFLPLDGGHIFWSLVEKVRGKPVPFRIVEQASVIGFMLVMVLVVIGFSNDLGRLTGGGFESR